MQGQGQLYLVMGFKIAFGLTRGVLSYYPINKAILADVILKYAIILKL